MISIYEGRTYCCATCACWSAADGCTMPASPATVNCGRTRADDLCEQWIEPEDAEKRVYWLTGLSPERRRLRELHYLDGAIYGADS